MTIENLEDVKHLLDEKPATFMITDAEIKEIFALTAAAGGNLSSRIRINHILSNVVHRTG